MGGRGQPSLMVASCLSRSRITSYVLDPPGDDDLWAGADEDLDELLRASPQEQDWQPRRAGPPEEVRQGPADVASPVEEIPSPTEDAPDAPVVFDVPAERRGWFAQILTRATAATALLFAGDNASAGEYTTPRQRGEEIRPSPELFEPESIWTLRTTQTLRMANGLRAEGTRHRAPLPGGGVTWRSSGAWTASCTGISRRAASDPTYGQRRVPSTGGRTCAATARCCPSAATAPSS